MRPNRLRELFAAKTCAMGGWAAFNSPYAAEVMGHSGFDTVVVDLQHGPLFLDAAVPMLQALSSTPAMPMARCSWNNFQEINKLLDAGAYGIICPMVDTPEDAARFVAACRYPPQGNRSFGPTRGILYGGADYADHANDTIVTYAMIETAQAMDNLDAICATPGLDGVFLGPADLSLALGVGYAVKWKQPPLSTAIERIVAAAKKAGRMAGAFCANEQMAIDLKKLGYDFVIAGQDAAMVKAEGLRRCDVIRKG